MHFRQAIRKPKESWNILYYQIFTYDILWLVLLKLEIVWKENIGNIVSQVNKNLREVVKKKPLNL